MTPVTRSPQQRRAFPARHAGRTAALAAGLVPLLRRMRGDFERDGRFAPTTAALMWGAYAVGSATFAGALRGARATPASAAAAAAPAATGTALLVAGMGAFGGAAQVTGTQAGPLVTGGVYRYSRNPQYTGIVLVAAAAAVATRNPRAAALTGLLAAAYRWWVPVEERALKREFGEPYRDYLARTPRWLGLPRD